MPTQPPRTTQPVADSTFVNLETGRLTFWAYQFLARLMTAANVTVENVTEIFNELAPPPPPPTTPSLAAIAAQSAALLGSPSGISAVQAQLAEAYGASLIALKNSAPSSVVILANGAVLSDGYGSPEGALPACVGDLYLRRDGGSSATAYVKETGAPFSATGWIAVGAGGGSQSLLPLVNGDLPGPSLMADPVGQTIGVPV